MLCAEFLPEPRGDWGTGQAGNVEVFLFPSLVLRPRMERDTGLLGGILLEITVHGLSLLGCAYDKLCSLSYMTPRIVSYFFKKLPGAVNG